jgi:hypothetical protein
MISESERKRFLQRGRHMFLENLQGLIKMTYFGIRTNEFVTNCCYLMTRHMQNIPSQTTKRKKIAHHYIELFVLNDL